MRALLAAVIAVGGISAPHAADAARKSMRSSKPPFDAVQRRDLRGEDAVCERRALADDPAGIYAGYPCWARSAFSRRPR